MKGTVVADEAVIVHPDGVGYQTDEMPAPAARPDGQATNLLVEMNGRKAVEIGLIQPSQLGALCNEHGVITHELLEQHAAFERYLTTADDVVHD